MLFHEIHGKYFAAVSAILREAAEQPISGRRLRQIVQEKAFAESLMTIPEALQSGKWPLLDSDGRSVLRKAPEMGLTLPEKRWMKTLLSDPRIALFDPDITGLEDVAPLYDPGDLVYFDRFADGDPYEKESYQANFRIILAALRENRQVTFTYNAGKPTPTVFTGTPCCLEYSGKDDKVRTRISTRGGQRVLNLARILTCQPGEVPQTPVRLPQPELRMAVLELRDARNALERVLLHFSWLKKETIRMEEDRYLVTLWYPPEDESDMLIQVLSFGPVVKVLYPEDFRDKIAARIEKQIRLWAL